MHTSTYSYIFIFIFTCHSIATTSIEGDDTPLSDPSKTYSNDFNANSPVDNPQGQIENNPNEYGSFDGTFSTILPGIKPEWSTVDDRFDDIDQNGEYLICMNKGVEGRCISAIDCSIYMGNAAEGCGCKTMKKRKRMSRKRQLKYMERQVCCTFETLPETDTRTCISRSKYISTILEAYARKIFKDSVNEKWFTGEVLSIAKFRAKMSDKVFTPQWERYNRRIAAREEAIKTMSRRQKKKLKKIYKPSRKVETEQDVMDYLEESWIKDFEYYVKRYSRSLKKVKCGVQDFVRMKLRKTQKGWLTKERNFVFFDFVKQGVRGSGWCGRRNACLMDGDSKRFREYSRRLQALTSKTWSEVCKKNLITSSFVRGSGYQKIDKNLAEVAEQVKKYASFGTYRSHSKKMYSLDAFIRKGVYKEYNDGEELKYGFYNQEKAKEFFFALDKAVDDIPGNWCWQAIYNDFEVAKAVNSKLHKKKVHNGRMHGPSPYVLHVHIDIVPNY